MDKRRSMWISATNINPRLADCHIQFDEKAELTDSRDSARDEAVRIGFFQVMKSTLSAFIGVQSNANRERDFRHGKMSHFIAMGLFLGLVFVLTLVGVVQLVLHLTQ